MRDTLRDAICVSRPAAALVSPIGPHADPDWPCLQPPSSPCSCHAFLSSLCPASCFPIRRSMPPAPVSKQTTKGNKINLPGEAIQMPSMSVFAILCSMSGQLSLDPTDAFFASYGASERCARDEPCRTHLETVPGSLTAAAQWGRIAIPQPLLG
ncbi:unnamed protein product [Periconia digitata]|uniref:Uncharacterized protein n=1 Tax=Periconia digitata TaxID=1303443 RepID=A0A9W4XJM4_9PLEO|nr:unnamed protein product [Periconia digitata]